MRPPAFCMQKGVLVGKSSALGLDLGLCHEVADQHSHVLLGESAWWDVYMALSAGSWLRMVRTRSSWQKIVRISDPGFAISYFKDSPGISFELYNSDITTSLPSGAKIKL